MSEWVRRGQKGSERVRKGKKKRVTRGHNGSQRVTGVTIKGSQGVKKGQKGSERVRYSLVKDRQQERTAVSSRSHLNALCTFTTPAIHEHYI